MIPTDPMDILLAHNAWANQQLFSACEKLTADHFHRRFEMGPGSIHDTITHIIGAMRRWGDLLAGREERPRLEGTQRSAAELLTLHDEIAENLAAAARAHPPDEIVTATRGGRTFARPRF